MRYSKHESDRKARHMVKFTEEEVMVILSDYAIDRGQGLPSTPTFIWYPQKRSVFPRRENDPEPRYVEIGVDVVE